MLGLLVKYLPDRDAPAPVAIGVVGIGSLLALTFGIGFEPYVTEAIQVAPFTPAVLAAALFGGRSAGVASLMLNTALVSSLLGHHDPGRTLGTFAFQLLFGAATFIAADALRVSARQSAARQAELLQREETLATLVDELDHRSKNLLSVVQLLARQTAAHADNLPGFETAFQDRLSALGRAQSLMIRARWGDVALGDIVDAALAPFRGEGPDGGVQITGGEPVLVDGQCALGLALALHELATNAGKYGALSVAGGSVSIDWRLQTNGLALFTWREKGGPPAPPPSRKGFGTTLLERMLAPHGEAISEFAPQGLCFTYLFRPAGAGSWTGDQGVVSQPHEGGEPYRTVPPQAPTRSAHS